ncbi:uncharacterized protein LOC121873581, partial [Homarus americanus]
DKYLSGEPISNYDDEWRSTTQSGETWSQRWFSYWLPALISKGVIQPTEKFTKMLDLSVDAYNFLVRKIDISSPDDLQISVATELYGDIILQTGLGMIYNGRFVALLQASVYGFNNRDKLMEQFGNASFTFQDFLRHVVWTHNLGMMDRHWMTFTEDCEPCRRKYQYILRLENIAPEFNYLLQQVLGYPDTIPFSLTHRSKHHANKSDLHFYNDVPKDIMNTVLNIYKHDIQLFSYNEKIV